MTTPFYCRTTTYFKFYFMFSQFEASDLRYEEYL